MALLPLWMCEYHNVMRCFLFVKSEHDFISPRRAAPIVALVRLADQRAEDGRETRQIGPPDRVLVRLADQKRAGLVAQRAVIPTGPPRTALRQMSEPGVPRTSRPNGHPGGWVPRRDRTIMRSWTTRSSSTAKFRRSDRSGSASTSPSDRQRSSGSSDASRPSRQAPGRRTRGGSAEQQRFRDGRASSPELGPRRPGIRSGA